MTHAAVSLASGDSGQEVGKKIAVDIREKLAGRKPHAVMLFCSSKYNYDEVLKAFYETCEPEHLIGCSSAGEFTHREHREGAVSAIGIWSDQIKFSSGLGRNLQANQDRSSEDMVATFAGVGRTEYRYHSAIVLADALVGYTEDFIKALTVKTMGMYQIAGGGAGDDARFLETHVFYGREAVKDAAVALEILSNEPVGVGIKHGWQVAGTPMRVTEAEGNRVFSFNGIAAVEAFQDHAEATGQRFDTENPIAFFLHNVVGIETRSGYKLRCPLSLHSDGSIAFASAIPNGAIVSIMHTTSNSAENAAVNATQIALSQMNGKVPRVGIFFDCAATRLRLGVDFGTELGAVARSLDGVEFVGCNTYGQIVRVDGQFNGFHNCTAVSCLLP